MQKKLAIVNLFEFSLEVVAVKRQKNNMLISYSFVVVIFEEDQCFRYGVVLSCLNLQRVTFLLPRVFVCVVTTNQYESSNFFTSCCCEYLSFEKSVFTAVYGSVHFMSSS